jgi:hypothetical protein
VRTAESSRHRSGFISRARRRILCLLLGTAFFTGCGSTQSVITEQQKALTSLTSTVRTVCRAWLDGNVSTTYARTALAASATLLEKKRAKIAGSPDAMSDARIASLGNAEQQLAQRIAVLRKALVDSDANTVRQVAATLDHLQP